LGCLGNGPPLKLILKETGGLAALPGRNWGKLIAAPTGAAEPDCRCTRGWV